MTILRSTPVHSTPMRREETLRFGVRPEQRDAFHRRREQEIDLIEADMRAQRAAMLAKLEQHGR